MALTAIELLQLTPAQRDQVSGLDADTTAYLATLCDRLILLKNAVYSPTKEVRFENGVDITYNSNAEIFRAIAALEAEIGGLFNAAPARFLRVGMRNGL